MAGTEPSKTRKVYLGLRDRIANGAYDSAGGLPGEQALAAEYGVSRVTLRRALAALESDGLIERRRGAGTFLTPAGKPQPIATNLSDVMSHLQAMGRSTDVRLMECALEAPPTLVRKALRLPEGCVAQRSLRLRLIDGAPFSHLVAYVPERIARSYSREELARQPLLSLIERAGCRVDRAEQEITAVVASPEVAQALGTTVGAALLSLTRVTYDANGDGLEYLRALYRPEIYTFRMDLLSTGDGERRRWTQLRPSGALQ